MPQSRILPALITLLVVVCLAWLASELRWARVNNPEQKFSDLRGYLAGDRLPGRIYTLRRGAETYFVALSPLDTWLALPSGPAGYVFDLRGGLVDWSPDIGEDSAFGDRWPEELYLEATLEELRAPAKTVPPEPSR